MYTGGKVGCGTVCCVGVIALVVWQATKSGSGCNNYIHDVKSYHGCNASFYGAVPEEPLPFIPESPLSLQDMVIRAIEKYQREVSPKLHQRLGVESICRYSPSCSEYAQRSIRKKGVFLGGADAVWRILRCNPFSSGGYDPVTPSETQEHFHRLGQIFQEDGFLFMLKYDWKVTKEDWFNKEMQ